MSMVTPASERSVYVFDFDGTCTMPVTGADEAFLTAHYTGLATLLERDPNWMREQYAAARAKIAADPSTYGWVINGQIVAPALVDAFVAAQVCAQLVLSGLGHDIETWEQRLNALYQEHYLVLETTFREEMLEVFQTLRERGIPFYIVSNSDPAKVQQRLTVLGDAAEWINPLVRGFAKKFVVTPESNYGRTRMLFKGLRRPISLQKQHYYDVLDAILEAHDTTWDKLTVIGDIAELDLAMPVSQGARGVLMMGPNTPDYEIEWALGHKRTKVIRNLRQAIT